MGWLRLLYYVIVIIFIFTGTLYLGIFELLGIQIAVIRTDFLVFIPLPIRLTFFFIFLALLLGLLRNLND